MLYCVSLHFESKVQVLTGFTYISTRCSLGLRNKCKCNDRVIWLVKHDLSKVVELRPRLPALAG